MTPFYTQISLSLHAMKNCLVKQAAAERSNLADKTHWQGMAKMHEDVILNLVKKHCPSGAGFDAGTSIALDASTPDKLLFHTQFHHMDDHGYTGWTAHKVWVRASLAFGIDISIGGPDKNGIKDYIHDSFRQLKDIDVSTVKREPAQPMRAILDLYKGTISVHSEIPLKILLMDRDNTASEPSRLVMVEGEWYMPSLYEGKSLPKDKVENFEKIWQKITNHLKAQES